MTRYVRMQRYEIRILQERASGTFTHAATMILTMRNRIGGFIGRTSAVIQIYIRRNEMNFASALFALKRGHKIKRHHWTGYWKLENGEVMMYTCDGKYINIRDSEDMLYTMENMACNDWEIVTEYHEVK